MLLQKTFVSNVLTKEVKKNTGELKQYYLPDAHTPIIPPEIFDKTQEEIARRASKRSASTTAKTVLGKYNSKYALSEIMVCGACGTKYRRITWDIRGKKK